MPPGLAKMRWLLAVSRVRAMVRVIRVRPISPLLALRDTRDSAWIKLSGKCQVYDECQGQRQDLCQGHFHTFHSRSRHLDDYQLTIITFYLCQCTCLCLSSSLLYPHRSSIRWSQGPINKLRLKGFQYIKDALPMSKFQVSLSLAIVYLLAS